MEASIAPFSLSWFWYRFLYSIYLHGICISPCFNVRKPQMCLMITIESDGNKWEQKDLIACRFLAKHSKHQKKSIQKSHLRFSQLHFPQVAASPTTYTHPIEDVPWTGLWCGRRRLNFGLGPGASHADSSPEGRKNVEVSGGAENTNRGGAKVSEHIFWNHGFLVSKKGNSNVFMSQKTSKFFWKVSKKGR